MSIKRQKQLFKIILISGFFLIQSISFAIPSGGLSSISLIPKPVSVTSAPGNFSLTKKSSICISGKSHELTTIGEYLSGKLRTATGFEMVVNAAAKTKASGNIYLSISKFDKQLGDEGYQLSIKGGMINLSANNPAGLFNGIQTIRQLLPPKIESSSIQPGPWQIPAGTIRDFPEYSYRGAMLDVARHFFQVDDVKRYIDQISAYKMNVLHLHLSDDQGWRIEIKKWPKLTSIGGSSQVGGEKGGFYTQKQYSEIVKYASERNITIIPEIDMPGHLSAAINAYPQLSCTGATGWGTDFSYPLCPCNTSVYDFANQIWDEVSALFPSSYVHIGADEVDKKTWQLSSECSDFMSTNNISNTTNLQNYFVGKIENHLESKSKSVIAWDDVTDGKISSNLKIMYWRDWVPNAPVIAAANGNQIIFTRWDLFYFSSTFSVANLQKLLEFDVTQIYPASVTNKIIGFQGCMWSEYIPSEAVFEAQVFPRLQALSEVNWSSVTDYNSFTTRMVPQRSYLLAQHVNLKN